MKILDLSAGKRAVWFDKNHRDAVYCDLRPEVNPTVVCDTRRLPPEVGDGFDLIVFDPPHVNFGANAQMSKTYGHHTTKDIREIVELSAKEAHRVSRLDALMAFKWNDHDQSFEKILKLMAAWWEPLFGHKVSVRTKHSSQTQWVLLRRISKPAVSLAQSGDTTSASRQTPGGLDDSAPSVHAVSAVPGSWPW